VHSCCRFPLLVLLLHVLATCLPKLVCSAPAAAPVVCSASSDGHAAATSSSDGTVRVWAVGPSAGGFESGSKAHWHVHRSAAKKAKAATAHAGVVDVALRLAATAVEDRCAAQMASLASEAASDADVSWLVHEARKTEAAASTSIAVAAACARLAQAAACAAVCVGHQGPVLRSSFSCGSRLLTTIGADGTARVWLTAPPLARSMLATRLSPDATSSPAMLLELQRRAEATKPLRCVLLATAVLAAPSVMPTPKIGVPRKSSMAARDDSMPHGPSPTLAHSESWCHDGDAAFCAASAGCHEAGADLATERARHMPQLFRLHGVKAPGALPAFMVDREAAFELHPNVGASEQRAGLGTRLHRRGWRAFAGSGSGSDSDHDTYEAVPGSTGLLCTQHPCPKSHGLVQVRCPHCKSLFTPPSDVLQQARRALGRRREAQEIITAALKASFATAVPSERCKAHEDSSDGEGDEETDKEHKEAASAAMGGDASAADVGTAGQGLDSIITPCASEYCGGLVQLIPWLLEAPRWGTTQTTVSGGHPHRPEARRTGCPLEEESGKASGLQMVTPKRGLSFAAALLRRAFGGNAQRERSKSAPCSLPPI
jgi:hypothetical protein